MSRDPTVGFVLQIKKEAYDIAADRQRRVAALLREVADQLETGEQLLINEKVYRGPHIVMLFE